jgi:Family of unknown function (DUF5338)
MYEESSGASDSGHQSVSSTSSKDDGTTMKTDNEVTAFAEYMAKRLGESPTASRRGKHRVAFIALEPLIEGALVRGYTMKGTWAALREQGRLSMSYQAFRSHCRRAGLPAPTSAAHAQGPAPSSAPERGFRHERVPRKKDIYG